MLFYGPSGAGKKTRIMALLRAIFGNGVERVKLEHRSFRLPTGRTLEMTTVASNYHIEINPGDAGIYDRYVVQELIKEMAAYNAMGAASEGRAHPWKVLLLSEVDRLSKEAQAALRRTMERYTATCRLILVATSTSKVIEPVRSRCLGVRVAAPAVAEIVGVLTAVAAKEGVTLPPPFAVKVANQSGRNLRRALLLLEAAKVASPGGVIPAAGSSAPLMMDWERYISLLGADIVKQQSPAQLLMCRNRVYELLVNCVPADVILRRLCGVLVTEHGKGMPDAFKHEAAHWAAHYEHRLQLGQKELFHIEAFCAKMMFVIKAGAMTGGGAGGAPGAAAAGAASGGGGGAVAVGGAGTR